jgi:hypothetical protein
MKGQVREALSLWLSPMPDDDLDELLADFQVARAALDSLLDGKLSLDDYLEILAACGVNMDDYARVTENNLLIVGA